jgi:hypothetical protein
MGNLLETKNNKLTANCPKIVTSKHAGQRGGAIASRSDQDRIISV